MESNGYEGANMTSIRWRRKGMLHDWQTVLFASDTAAMNWLIDHQYKIESFAIERY